MDCVPDKVPTWFVLSALTTFPPWFLKTFPPLAPRREVVNFPQDFVRCPV